MLEFIKANLRWLSAGFLLCLFSGFGQTYFISLSNEAIRSALSLSHSDFGLIYAIATLASAGTLTKFGSIVDRWSIQKSAVVTLVGLSVACFLMSVSVTHFLVLILALYGLRVFGQGFCGHVAFTAAGKWFSKNRGKAISLVGLGFPVSEALLPPLGAMAITVIGLPFMWGLSGVLVCILALPAIFTLLRQDRYASASSYDEVSSLEEDVLQWRRADVLRRVEFYLLNIAVLCPPFMVTAFFFHQQHLVEIKNWPIGAMVASMVMFAGFQIAAKLVTGWIIDRNNARSLLPYYLIPMAAGFALPFFVGSSLVIPLVLALLGMSAGISATLLGVLWPELFGARYLGEIRSVAYAAMVASTAASPFLTGYLIDAGISFDLQLLGFTGFCLLASAVMFLIQPLLSGLNGRLAK